ncbi:MAG: TonB family protein [Aquificaceae bacterium]
MATNPKLKAYTFSFLLHLSLLLLFLFITKKPLQEKKIVEIDLSLSYIVPQKEERQQEPTARQEKPKAKVISQAPKNIPIPKEEKRIKIPAEEKIEESKLQERITETKTQETASTPQEETTTKGQGEITQTPVTSSPSKVATSGSFSKGDEASHNKKDTIDPKQAQDMYLQEKLFLISSIVQKHISYPPLARRMGWEGRVVVRFTLTSEGKLENVHIEKSSGYDLLDKNAMETVKRVAHLFPKPPVDVVVKLPVNYRLE